MTKKGAFVAAAVASMFSAAVPLVASAKAGGKVQCMGTNECKGKSGCHSANNACPGQNACKGKGWTEMPSAKACTDKGGTVVSDDKK